MVCSITWHKTIFTFIFFHILAQKPNLEEKKIIYSNKFFYNCSEFGNFVITLISLVRTQFYLFQASSNWVSAKIDKTYAELPTQNFDLGEIWAFFQGVFNFFKGGL